MIRIVTRGGKSAHVGYSGWESDTPGFVDDIQMLMRNTKVNSQNPLYWVMIAREVGAKLGARVEISEDELVASEIDEGVVY